MTSQATATRKPSKMHYFGVRSGAFTVPSIESSVRASMFVRVYLCHLEVLDVGFAASVGSKTSEFKNAYVESLNLKSRLQCPCLPRSGLNRNPQQKAQALS